MTTDPRTVIRDKVAMALFRADDMVAKPDDWAWSETTAASYQVMADAAIAAHLEALEQANRSAEAEHDR